MSKPLHLSMCDVTARHLAQICVCVGYMKEISSERRKNRNKKCLLTQDSFVVVSMVTGFGVWRIL